MNILHILAQVPRVPTDNIPTLTGEVVTAGILNTFYFIAGFVAVIVIIIAGFTFVVGGGNPASVAKAKNAILYSVIGLVVIIFAFAITQFVLGRF